MMREVKEFTRDLVVTFIVFAFQGLYMIVDVMHECFQTIKRFILNFLIPSLIDLCTDMVYITRSLRYESCVLMNEVCLTLSRFFIKSAEYFQDKAEQTNSKRAW